MYQICPGEFAQAPPHLTPLCLIRLIDTAPIS
jgi:hypothetical protein